MYVVVVVVVGETLEIKRANSLTPSKKKNPTELAAAALDPGTRSVWNGWSVRARGGRRCRGFGLFVNFITEMGTIGDGTWPYIDRGL